MKPYRSTHDLVALLRDERGLAISNEDDAVAFLRKVNYYRFTGYSRHFQVDPRSGKNDYLNGSDFSTICDLMRKDDELRIRLLVPISEVEIGARTRFAHLTGRECGGESFYLNPANYISDTKHTLERIGGIQRELRETSSPTVRRYRRDDDVSKVPIWVAVEVLSFGKIAWMVESLALSSLRDELADFFSYSRATFPRVLHSLSTLRNSCAHHGQLWNRRLVTQCPKPLNKREIPRDVKFHEHGLYPALIALRKLTHDQSSRTQLAVIERRLRAGGLHANGVLNPEGVR